MNSPLLRAIAIFACATVVGFSAACGGGDDADPTTSASTPGSTQAAATEPAGETTTTVVESPTAQSTAVTTPVVSGTAAGGPTVQKGATGLVDAGGFSLYIFASDVEGSGQSACVAGCSSAWPPLVVDGLPTAGPDVTGELGTITRLDGSLQVTYNGKPLYRWINDVNPGDTTGTAIKNWSLAQP